VKKDPYVEKLQAKLDEWNAEIEKLQARARQAQADTRIEYEEQVAELKGKRDALKDKLREIRAASDEAWEEMKKGADEAFDRVKEAVERARRKFGSS